MVAIIAVGRNGKDVKVSPQTESKNKDDPQIKIRGSPLFLGLIPSIPRSRLNLRWREMGTPSVLT